MEMNRLSGCEHRSTLASSVVTWGGMPLELAAARFRRMDPFFRVRHYGLLANYVKRELLPRCRRLLGAHVTPAGEPAPATAGEWLRRLLGVDVTRCPCCGETLEREPLPRLRPPPGPSYAPPPFPEFEAWNTF